MEKKNINDFIRGWFVGGFEPTLFKTQDVEVAVQQFSKGDKAPFHCHKVATEITMIVQGRAEMSGEILNEGDIVKVSPGEFTDFEALEDTKTIVVKLPGALNDKYLASEEE